MSLNSDAPDSRPWFPRKRFGYGWGLPDTVQGWLVLIGYFGLMLAPVPVWNVHQVPIFWLVVYHYIVTAALVAIVFIKGE